MSEHTPGPWRLDDTNSAVHRLGLISPVYHFIDAGRGYVGDGFGIGGCIGEADARLIAAAPDLYEFVVECATDRYDRISPGLQERAMKLLDKAKGQR